MLAVALLHFLYMQYYNTFYIAPSRLNGDEIHETRLHAIMIIALLHPVEAFNESVNRAIDGSYTEIDGLSNGRPSAAV